MVYLKAEDSTLSECSVFFHGGALSTSTWNVAYLQHWITQVAMLKLAINESMP